MYSESSQGSAPHAVRACESCPIMRFVWPDSHIFIGDEPSSFVPGLLSSMAGWERLSYD